MAIHIIKSIIHSNSFALIIQVNYLLFSSHVICNQIDYLTIDRVINDIHFRNFPFRVQIVKLTLLT